jgi:outer membrane protein assembly factor BamB
MAQSLLSVGRPLARTLCLAAAITAAVTAAGCATSTKKADAPAAIDPNETLGSAKFPIRAAEWAKFGYRWDWSGFPYVSRGQKLTRMVPFGDAILTQEGGSAVSLLEASNGRERWSSAIGGPLNRYVGLTRYNDAKLGDVALGCSESEITFLSVQTGELLDRQKPERVVDSAPLLLDDTAVFGSQTGQLLGHLLTRGVKLWGFQSESAVQQSPVLLNDSTFAAVSQSGEVLFFNTIGELSARARCYAGPGSPLAAGDGNLFVASLDQSLYCFGSQGQPIWRHRTNAPIRGTPIYHSGYLVCDLPDTGLTAFEAATGKVLWSIPETHGTVVTVRAGNLIVQDGPRVSVVDFKHGDLVHTSSFPGLGLLAPDKFIDGNLYAMSPAGVVTKFVPR